MRKISIESENKRDVHAVPVVNSYNEWDPLEEVVVSVIEGATVPHWHISIQATMPKSQWIFYQQFGGKLFPQEQIETAKKGLDAFVHILEVEGVIVRGPEVMNHNVPYSTPEWNSPGGLYAAIPRDVIEN
jgi:glycine amidinotransferase